MAQLHRTPRPISELMMVPEKVKLQRRETERNSIPARRFSHPPMQQERGQPPLTSGTFKMKQINQSLHENQNDGINFLRHQHQLQQHQLEAKRHQMMAQERQFRVEQEMLAEHRAQNRMEAKAEMQAMNRIRMMQPHAQPHPQPQPVAKRLSQAQQMAKHHAESSGSESESDDEAHGLKHVKHVKKDLSSEDAIKLLKGHHINHK